MTVYITLTTASTATGPFDLYQDSDSYVVPFATNIPRSVLLAGYSTTIDDTSRTIKIQSDGICSTYEYVSISNLPSPTPTNTPTNTATQTQTPTNTATQTQTQTPTQTPTNTATQTQTPTQTTTTTLTATVTQTPTNTATQTMTPSRPASGTTEANNYLTAVVDAGGTGITATISAATRTLFTSLVSNGLYNKLQVMYPMLGGNSAGCKFNALNPVDSNAAYRLTFNGGWTYNSSGATSNGTNAYADTFLSGTSINPYDNHLSVNMINNTVLTGTGASYMGVSAPGGAGTYFYLGQDGNPYYYYGCETTGGVSAVIAPQPRGINLITTTASTFVNLFRNGTLVKASSGTSGVTTNSIVIAALNNSGTIQQYYGNTYSFATIGYGLSEAQQSTLTTIINTFQTTLSRNTY